MALELQGSATTIKRRDKTKRMKCGSCNETIPLRSEWVYNEEHRRVHLVCAAIDADVNHGGSKLEVATKLQPCPDCFMIAPCLCVGS